MHRPARNFLHNSGLGLLSRRLGLTNNGQAVSNCGAKIGHTSTLGGDAGNTGAAFTTVGTLGAGFDEDNFGSGFAEDELGVGSAADG